MPVISKKTIIFDGNRFKTEIEITASNDWQTLEIPAERLRFHLRRANLESFGEVKPPGERSSSPPSPRPCRLGLLTWGEDLKQASCHLFIKSNRFFRISSMSGQFLAHYYFFVFTAKCPPIFYMVFTKTSIPLKSL